MAVDKVYANISIALHAVLVLLFCITGYHYQTSYPPVAVALVFGLGGFFSYLIVKYLVRHLLVLPKYIPKTYLVLLISFIGCSFILRFIGFRFPEELYYQAMLLIIACVSVFFLCLHLVIDRGLKTAMIGLLVPLIIVGGGVWWLSAEGSELDMDKLGPSRSAKNVNTLADQQIKSPSSSGSFEVEKYTYGSGDDFRRIEYGSAVKFKTEKVDASLMLPQWKGKAKKWRERYWKFGIDSLPLNGRVYMPTTGKNHPLILIVHGNHSMIDYSDDGYGYLGELLASRGHIVVSVDENFLNGHWSGDFMGKEMPARAWLLLKHLQQWRSWSEDSIHEMFGKVDLNNIMLIGHSRGGEAVSIAAKFNKLNHFPDNAKEIFDFGFNIKGIVSIAPTDYRYHRQMDLENINYLSIQGSYDSDETSFWGMRPYHRLTFNDDKKYVKAGVYVHKANHGQFNSTWGRADMGAPFKWLLNTKPMISASDQRKTGTLFISAFAEYSLKGNEDYLPVFHNAESAGDWLPKNYCLTQFQHSDDYIIQDFEEDIELSSGSNKVSIKGENLKVWREENLTTRKNGSQENNTVILGWDYGDSMDQDSLARYSLTMTNRESLSLDGVKGILLRSATGNLKDLPKPKKKNDSEKKDDKSVEKEELLDYSIELIDSLNNVAHVKLSDVKQLAPQLKTRFLKLKSLDKEMFGSDWEVQLQSFILPLTKFKQFDTDFDITALSKISIVFDQTKKGVIVVDDIGFSY